MRSWLSSWGSAHCCTSSQRNSHLSLLSLVRFGSLTRTWCWSHCAVAALGTTCIRALCPPSQETVKTFMCGCSRISFKSVHGGKNKNLLRTLPFFGCFPSSRVYLEQKTVWVARYGPTWASDVTEFILGAFPPWAPTPSQSPVATHALWPPSSSALS